MKENIYDNELLLKLAKSRIDDCLKRGEFKIKEYGCEEIIHLEGDRCTSLEILLDGKVSVERLDREGGILNITEFGRDDVLGANLLFSRRPTYPMIIKAKEKTTLIEIEKDVMFKLLSEEPEFLKAYLTYMSDHSAILTRTIKNAVKRSLRESILGYLEYERKVQKSNIIYLNMTKKEFAEKLGVERTSLSRELAKMRRDGLLEFDAKTIKILQES